MVAAQLTTQTTQHEQQQHTRQYWEAQAQRGQRLISDGRYLIGESLYYILRVDESYTTTHDTQKAYIRDTFGKSAKWARQLINYFIFERAERAKDMSLKVRTESHAREILKHPVDMQGRIRREGLLNAQSEGRNPTVHDFRAAAQVIHDVDNIGVVDGTDAHEGESVPAYRATINRTAHELKQQKMAETRIELVAQTMTVNADGTLNIIGLPAGAEVRVFVSQRIK